MLADEFSYEVMSASSAPGLLAQKLAQELTLRLRAANDPGAECLQMVAELRTLGHDLWSFDESIDFQHWCGDWTKSSSAHELIVEFAYPEDEPRRVDVTFQRRRT